MAPTAILFSPDPSYEYGIIGVWHIGVSSVINNA